MNPSVVADAILVVLAVGAAVGLPILWRRSDALTRLVLSTALLGAIGGVLAWNALGELRADTHEVCVRELRDGDGFECLESATAGGPDFWNVFISGAFAALAFRLALIRPHDWVRRAASQMPQPLPGDDECVCRHRLWNHAGGTGDLSCTLCSCPRWELRRIDRDRR